MKKLLWSLTLFGLTLLVLPVDGMMEFDEMEWFTDFNGTKMFQTESDVYSDAKFPMGGLTLIQSAAAKGAVCLDGSLQELARSIGGILSDKAVENPDFYNCNRVKVRYCDGGSFSGDSENKAAKLQFRGKRIWLAATEELMAKGMRSALGMFCWRSCRDSTL
ncbi:hypothetical protein HID58_013444 [Brassica napus]|uniref:Pectin acetylesterase n=1 Tax=Brassica napus TaxID=3708 RepID=A0ABQ8E3Y3_BRANA|nr:hypothetical protein HID58_013444 [Brassica napus]